MKKILLIKLSMFLAGHSLFSQTSYSGVYNDRIAFPIGGMGAGMFCLEGTGAVSHFSIYNAPAVFNEPPLFAALSKDGIAKIIEGPVPGWKKYGMPNAAQGVYNTTWGLPRFSETISFTARFPFCEVKLKDKEWPVTVSITGWSPFIPTDADNSGLPVGALEYRITNTASKQVSYVFTYSAKRFNGFREIKVTTGGFVFQKGDTCFSVSTDDASAQTDHYWYGGSWVDPMTIAWKNVQNGKVQEVAPKQGGSGATISIPVVLKAGESKTIKVFFSWYVPSSDLRYMGENWEDVDDKSLCYKPWYASKFKSIEEVNTYWKDNYDKLKTNTKKFTDAFYRCTLPKEVIEAVAANLSILKSPTVMRQYDGRLWNWEGCQDNDGSCPGSCTHVWNYAQALPHLFPSLERTLRETEFNENQDSTGHQMFRTPLPIRPAVHNFHAAADGQLGGIMKVYRDWRISGDDAWLKKLYPAIKQSLDYCIKTWDPKQKGIIEEPHHNTYDIELWGPEPMCTGMYLGALEALIQISDYLGEGNAVYHELLAKGKKFMEQQLWNGKYFQQQVEWKDLQSADPVTASRSSLALARYSPDDLTILEEEGPKYQYGEGCLSDGMIGVWMAKVCGLPLVLDSIKVQSHLQSIYQYNFKKDLSDHSNPQRVTYAIGNEGGVLLCTWPNGKKPTLPFTHCDEVWSGIEYEVASHLIFEGKVKEGLEIVRAVRKRYDGKVRNPFDEYECGHWYARALSSYALIEALTGVRYDAVTKTLYVDSKIGNFTSFLSTNTGFGNVIYKNGRATYKSVYGTLLIDKIIYGHAKQKSK